MWGDNGRQGLRKAGAPSNTGTLSGDNGKQGETRPPEGGQTNHHGHTCGEKVGNRNKARQDLGKADAPSNNKGKPEGRWETLGDKRGQGLESETRRETRGDKTLGRRV